MKDKAAVKEPELILVGGQAVIEGVLMRSKEKTVVCVRAEKGNIVRKEWKIRPLYERRPYLKFFKYPVVRGVGVLYDTLVLGFKALAFSANVAGGTDEKGVQVMGKKEMILSFAVAIAMALGIFVIGPLFLASLLSRGNTLLFNSLDGLFRLMAFVAYLIAISLFKDVRRIFEYHGAEHMTIHAYEHKEKLVPVKIRKYRTMHPRCGTSFLLLVIILSILVFSLLTPESFILKILSRILLLPLIAGLAYEALRLGARYQDNILMQILVWPGILLQRITTKEPDTKQIEVAIAALKAVLRKTN